MNRPKENQALSQVFYEVTATFTDPAAVQPWLDWLANKHIADVCAAGATSGRVVRLDDSPRTFAAQYAFPDRDAFDRYIRDHAPRLRDEGAAQFPPDQVTYTRRSGDVL
jgi:hypothetical protein